VGPNTVPLQNRVTPFGSIVATPARGAWMGNRGRLHDDRRTLTRRRWTTKAWLICRLSFKGRRRPLMAPGRYTELFFLDEATALAAGHRPCAECRRPDYLRYRALWAEAAGRDPRTLRVGDIDAVLHKQRLVGPDDRERRRGLQGLPNGVFVAFPDTSDIAWLLDDGRLWRWSSEGYSDPQAITRGDVILLTPPATVAVLAQGYHPQIDPGVGS
jgi:hypothetical protein